MFKLKDIPIHPDYYEYPYEDGELMAESTLQADWIEIIKGNVNAMTEGLDVFVAMDLHWYPVQGRKDICKAPDVMVVLGRPKGPRLSYLQWHEENVAPQVVFEILSKSNRRRMNKENLLEFYTRYGVEEYYSYDPVSNIFKVYIRQDDRLVRLENLLRWTSPLLKIRFELGVDTLKIFDPEGKPFLSFSELTQEAKFKEKELAAQNKKVRFLIEQENYARQDAEAEKLRAETEKLRAETAEQLAQAEARRAQTAEARQKLLAEKLRALGFDPDAV